MSHATKSLLIQDWVFRLETPHYIGKKNSLNSCLFLPYLPKLTIQIFLALTWQNETLPIIVLHMIGLWMEPKTIFKSHLDYQYHACIKGQKISKACFQFGPIFKKMHEITAYQLFPFIRLKRCWTMISWILLKVRRKLF